VASHRVTILGWNETLDHLKSYNNIDIGLDTSPYVGTTTTYEALCMGVPVVTLQGRFHVSRVGSSLLKRLGLEIFVAHRPEAYIAKALAFAQQLNALSQIRSSLRPMLLASSLCQPDASSHPLEGATRSLWRRWCGPKVDATVDNPKRQMTEVLP